METIRLENASSKGQGKNTCTVKRREARTHKSKTFAMSDTPNSTIWTLPKPAKLFLILSVEAFFAVPDKSPSSFFAVLRCILSG